VAPLLPGRANAAARCRQWHREVSFQREESSGAIRVMTGGGMGRPAGTAPTYGAQ